MEELERRADGTFARGVSGNPNGRPRKRQPRHRMPSDVYDAFLRVAEQLVTIKTAEGTEQISNLEMAARATFRDAGKGKLGAQKLVQDMAVRAALDHGQRTDLVKGLALQVMHLQNQILELEARLPPLQTNGVLVETADGRFIPNSYLRQITSG